MSEDFIDWLLSHKIVQVILEKVIFFVVSPHGIFIILPLSLLIMVLRRGGVKEVRVVMIDKF